MEPDSRKLAVESIRSSVDCGLRNEVMFVFVKWFTVLNGRELH
jgi:hypothetical protein